MKIVIYSIPFGFGPTGKAITISEHLKGTHKIKLATFGHSLQLAEKLSDIDIIDVKSRCFSEWDKQIFEEADLIISIMDLRFVKFVSENYPNLIIVFFDSLFWWRKNFHEFPLESNAYYILQIFPGVLKKVELIPFKYRNKFEISTPLIFQYNIAPKINENSKVVIHLGGVSSLIVDWNRYEAYFITIINCIVNSIQKKEIKVVGNSQLMEALKNYVFDKKIEFLCLPHSEFQILINDSFTTVHFLGEF